MADSAVNSTKSEDRDTGEVTDSKVSSSLSSSSTYYTESASGNDANQVVSSSNTDTGVMCQPPKIPSSSPNIYGNAFSGSGHNPGIYSNPFVPRAPLRTDVVSTGHFGSSSEDRDTLIAPSRLNVGGNKESSEADDNSCKYLKPSVLAAPKFPGATGFGSSHYDSPSSTFSSVNSFHIRPSVFSNPFETASPRSTSLLKPAKLPDPTKASEAKADSASDAEALRSCEKAAEASSPSDRLGGADGGSGGSEVSSSSSTSSVLPPNKTDDTDGATAAEAAPYNQDIVPDISKNNRLKESSGVSSSSPSNFVFGRNLSQRVTGVAADKEASASSGFVFGESLTTRVVPNTNGTNTTTTTTTTSTMPDKDDDSESDGADETQGEKMNRTLEESAREYQARHEMKTELKEVERVTGEEDESNVLQANAKLFIFESTTQSWLERGRGFIRVNDLETEDSNHFQSRLVMRTQGNLRVVLNTKLWPGMSLERASTKSIRITAMDTDEKIKIFLVTTNTKDSENLLRAIDWRIQKLKIREEQSRQHAEARTGDKRKADDTDFELPSKNKKISSPTDHGVLMAKKEESDSSVQDPETEASCESHSSSLTIKSESD